VSKTPILLVVCQLCDGPCHCPWPPPTCPVGVALVLDGCRCCQMCARQEGEPCTERELCDGRQGLQCDYSASFPGGPERAGCELDGVRYEEGQSFQPTCMQLCHCVGGGITCVPLCNEDLNLPMANCPNPRLAQLPGRCCREWVCDGLDNSVLLETTSGKTAVQTQYTEYTAQKTTSVSESVSLILLFIGICLSKMNIVQITEWSACSRSCGPGVSTRMSNRNWACRPQTQTRLCQVRPCHLAPRQPPTSPDGDFCFKLLILSFPLGCHSTRSYRPLYCGTCTDTRCCTPHRTRTAHTAFRCPQGGLVQHRVMIIETCACHYHCPHLPLPAPGGPDPGCRWSDG
uniref:Cellular communication network factor 5 n=1 Tax=Astyanax mexicanus TaxID=7994 RepID=A0A3B1JQQ0_ASTMX